MSLDATERASIIAAAMKKKFGLLLKWERPVLLHQFGPNNLDNVDAFEARLNEVHAEVLTAFDAMTDETVQEIGIQLSTPHWIGESVWGALSADQINRLERFLPPIIAYGFGHPNFTVDFGYWSKMPKLSLHEVTVISVGANPNSITEQKISELSKIKKTGKELWAAEDYLLQHYEIFRRHYHHTGWGYIAESTSKIKTWIDQIALPVHPDFYAALETRFTSKVSVIEAVTPKPMTSQERETLLKLLAGMACEQYGYDPRLERSTVPSSIKEDLARVGISMDDKTIRKWLKEASRLVDAEYWKVD